MTAPRHPHPPGENARPERRAEGGGLILGAVVAGWCIHDVMLLAWSGYPRELPALLVTMALLIVVAVALGGLFGPRRQLVLGTSLVASAALPLGALVGVPGLERTHGVLALVVFIAVALSWIAEHWAEEPGARQEQAKANDLGPVDRLALGLWLGASAGAMLSMARAWRPLLTRGELVWPQVLLAVSGVVCVWCFARASRRAGHAVSAVVAGVLLVFLVGGFSTRPAVPSSETKTVGDATPSPEPRPNVVLIVLDTVRADRLAPYSYQRLTTPRLDGFVARHSTIYPRAYSTSSWTVPSHGSLLTGLPPSEHGAVLSDVSHERHDWLRAVSPLPADQTTLAERLAAVGYRSAGIVANSPLLARGRGFEQGFDHYDDRAFRPFPATRSLLVQLGGGWPHIGAEPWRDAVSISRAAIDWLERGERPSVDGSRAQPFFLFLNYMDAHMPLVPRRRHRDAFSGERPRDVLRPKTEDLSDLYDRKLLSLDEGLHELLGMLTQRPDFGDTMVVITSDHGEAFGEHESWGHNQTLYEEVIRVPLYIKWPGKCSERLDPDEPVLGYRVPGLILRCAGLGAMPTENDWPLAELRVWPDRKETSSEPAAETVVAWLTSNHKSIVDSRYGVEIYDLERDPLETTNLATTQIASTWVQRALEWWTRAEVRRPTGAPEISAEDKARLRRLGYVE